ncbi:virulence factor TspB C-terminal domain-related protein [Zobellella endophytica]|uniref:virulence factor TspB C-terminal domain-related protein n=1 Tax=Zobellella endophytica TaxID=2116700 RepID=UPI0011B22239|nr:virulence factor TspB C-terminal domain-related protein [Zobellella endophytica]
MDARWLLGLFVLCLSNLALADEPIICPPNALFYVSDTTAMPVCLADLCEASCREPGCIGVNGQMAVYTNGNICGSGGDSGSEGSGSEDHGLSDLPSPDDFGIRDSLSVYSIDGVYVAGYESVKRNLGQIRDYLTYFREGVLYDIDLLSSKVRSSSFNSMTATISANGAFFKADSALTKVQLLESDLDSISSDFSSELSAVNQSINRQISDVYGSINQQVSDIYSYVGDVADVAYSAPSRDEIYGHVDAMIDGVYRHTDGAYELAASVSDSLGDVYSEMNDNFYSNDMAINELRESIESGEWFDDSGIISAVNNQTNVISESLNNVSIPEIPGGSTEIPTDSFDINEFVMDKVDLNIFDSHATCPPDVNAVILGEVLSFTYQPFCDFAEYVRPAILLIAWIAFAFIVMRSRYR